MSLDVSRRWAAHVEVELKRLEAGGRDGVAATPGSRGVVLYSDASGDIPILRPGSLALTALVQLPDGAGVDAAWGALSSIPDVDAAVERRSAEEASSRESLRASATPIADAWIRGGMSEVFATSEADPTDVPPAAAPWRGVAGWTDELERRWQAGEVDAFGRAVSPSASEAPAPGAMGTEDVPPWTAEQEHRWLCHPDGGACADDGTCQPDQDRLRQHNEQAGRVPEHPAPLGASAARAHLGSLAEGVALIYSVGLPPPEPPPGAMRPETRRRIEEALEELMVTRPPRDAPLLVSLAIYSVGLAATCHTSGERHEGHILRAIAYLVRRLELDAPAPEEPR